MPRETHTAAIKRHDQQIAELDNGMVDLMDVIEQQGQRIELLEFAIVALAALVGYSGYDIWVKAMQNIAAYDQQQTGQASE